MNQKAEKPTLTGHRLKTRKRDEREKNDPTAFRDAILQGVTDSGDSLEQLTKFLDTSGSKLDYRRYAECLFDVLFAGGILAPGGSIVEDDDEFVRPELCVFSSAPNHDAVKAYYEMFYKLIRRYKYLEKSFEDELKKLIVFLKGFREEERRKLAMITGICLANGLGNPTALGALFEDHLVKEGLAMEFATHLFCAWLQERDLQNVAAALKRANLETKLMNLLPINKRTIENFENHFKTAGLEEIVQYQRAKASLEVRKELQKTLSEMIESEEPVKEIISTVKSEVRRNAIPDHDAVVMAWSSLMSSVEWNKKEELVADQAVKHLRTYSPLLAALASSPRSELALITKVQEYCYDNINFMKVFQKIIVLFYKADVLSEDTILKWYKEAHLPKGKSHFLEQMKKFVEWLEQAEEEDSDEE